MARAPRILLAGGGTGGHVFPALAIADELKKRLPIASFLFIGTRDKIEARVVPERGYAFDTIWISGFHRRLRFGNLLFPIKVAVAMIQSFFLIKKFKPDVVIGTGGYVCGPILLAASLLGVKTVIHESNSYPGVTTRLLAHRVTMVITAFDATQQWLKRTDNVVRIGTPVREALGSIPREEAARRLKIDPNKKTVLVFGGSLGAASINNAMLCITGELQNEGIQVLWQTGASDYERIARQTTVRSVSWLGAFIDRMEDAYAAADVVVCRAGALTIAELTRLGKPAILIPYPRAAGDHQTINAKVLLNAGAAKLIADSEVREKLKDAITELLADESARKHMARASRALGTPHAGAAIAETILKLIQ
ncbi:MAG: undecaprenyldiphospho-muramoylpentapeptide beta-N-acetylglucosaminyltransferase [Ignavibacteriales bacterium]|nr:undecaprenyldiphospho-muramoylpentapeptide beta-N-acetylglucosaminyltransferase [Ignavibacteriales bacterium]